MTKRMVLILLVCNSCISDRDYVTVKQQADCREVQQAHQTCLSDVPQNLPEKEYDARRDDCKNLCERKLWLHRSKGRDGGNPFGHQTNISYTLFCEDAKAQEDIAVCAQAGYADTPTHLLSPKFLASED